MSRREHYLELLGIDLWQLRATAPAPAAAVAPRGAVAAEGGAAGKVAVSGRDAVVDETVDDTVWERLRTEVSACRRCALCESRTQTVFGVGDRRAELLVIGEAPGAEEDRRGEPFVGRAGQLLNSMLRAIGCARETVYIANVLKCRPPGNRDPSPAEVASCRPYLSRQIELLSPRLILVVGRIAAQNLLATDVPIGRLRGSVHRFGPQATPLVVTYHPAYLLRSPGEKRRAWQDLKLARSELHKARSAPSAPVASRVGLGTHATVEGTYSA
jgi:uracil-DNA glycosylase